MPVSELVIQCTFFAMDPSLLVSGSSLLLPIREQIFPQNICKESFFFLRQSILKISTTDSSLLVLIFFKKILQFIFSFFKHEKDGQKPFRCLSTLLQLEFWNEWWLNWIDGKRRGNDWWSKLFIRLVRSLARTAGSCEIDFSVAKFSSSSLQVHLNNCCGSQPWAHQTQPSKRSCFHINRTREYVSKRLTFLDRRRFFFFWEISPRDQSNNKSWKDCTSFSEPSLVRTRLLVVNRSNAPRSNETQEDLVHDFGCLFVLCSFFPRNSQRESCGILLLF